MIYEYYDDDWFSGSNLDNCFIFTSGHQSRPNQKNRRSFIVDVRNIGNRGFFLVSIRYTIK